MKGSVYKLWSLEGDLIYIGSTKQKLCWRLYYHKNHLDCSSKILFQNYKVVKIELIEIVEYTDKQELTAREGHFIRTLDCVNKNIAGRPKKEQQKEYYETHKDDIKKNRETHKEQIAEQQKGYYQNNKEQILENLKKKITCECGCEITKGELTRHKKSKKHIKLLSVAQLE